MNNKHFSAIISAILITIAFGLAIFLIAGNALFNVSSVKAANSPNAASTQVQTGSAAQNSSSTSDTQVQQLQSQIQQYQQQLTQDNQAIQQYQQILSALQQRGLIMVNQNGQILIPSGFGGDR